jgi:hypothetical protein
MAKSIKSTSIDVWGLESVSHRYVGHRIDIARKPCGAAACCGCWELNLRPCRRAVVLHTARLMYTSTGRQFTGCHRHVTFCSTNTEYMVAQRACGNALFRPTIGHADRPKKFSRFSAVFVKPDVPRAPSTNERSFWRALAGRTRLF